MELSNPMDFCNFFYRHSFFSHVDWGYFLELKLLDYFDMTIV